MVREYSKRLRSRAFSSENKEIKRELENTNNDKNLNENDLDAFFEEINTVLDDFDKNNKNTNDDAVSVEEEISEEIQSSSQLTIRRQEILKDFEKSEIGKDTYRCIYCNLHFIYRRIERHLESKRHATLKKAHEEASKNSKPENTSSYTINCPNDGCYTTSILGKKYVYCVDCKRNLINLKRVLWPHMLSITHQNAKEGAKNVNTLLKSSNRHRHSTNLDKNKRIGLVKVVKESSPSSSECEDEDPSFSTINGVKDDSFTRYLQLKKTFKDLCYCIYCKQFFRLVTRKRHLSLQKHALNKKNFKEEKKINKNFFDVDDSLKIDDCFKKSEKGDNFVFCIYCKNHLSTKRKSNLNDHVKTTKHIVALGSDKDRLTQENQDKNDENSINEEESNNHKNDETNELLFDNYSGIICNGEESDSSNSSSTQLDEPGSTAATLAAYLTRKRRRRKRISNIMSKSIKQELF